MYRILDKIVDALLVILSGRNRVNSAMSSFLNRGHNGIFFLLVLLLVPFLIVSVFLYNGFDNLLWAIIPIILYGIIILFFSVKLRMEQRLGKKNTRTREEVKGFNLDLNHLVFKKLFAYLQKYGYVNEELTSYQEFYNVMTLNFDEHHDVVHFDMNLAELKYILEKIKRLKKGVTLTSFEKSNRIYNKGKLITQKGLTSAYSDNIPDKEYREHVDDFFEFLTDI
ncbi:hypothetical protein [Ulvibacterium marinum]|uniref:Uncharacterized protein n=1 Tax=Ulvibacterium marinum TaxID=2419782 RepID=A0A3B0CF16_9FLAO|nr:hypothetical protein [Ulvibacterium marinum]RKN83458.1 hypothetical protein D7Z94_06450 [Ulvibacterium marinum]